jgi:hypothetical protein
MEERIRYLLVLLVGLTACCGIAASVTVSLLSAYADVDRGYESSWTDDR